MVKTGEISGGQQADANQTLDAPVEFFGNDSVWKFRKFLVQCPNNNWNVGEQNGYCC